jgi:hypothetical protein
MSKVHSRHMIQQQQGKSPILKFEEV